MAMSIAAKRANKEKVRARASELASILLDGGDLEEHIRKKQLDPTSVWFVPEGQKTFGYSQVRRYVAKAEALIAKTGEKDRGKLLHRHLAMRRRLYSKALEQNDIRTALSVLQDEARLLGLYPAEETATAGKDGNRITLTVIEQLIINKQPAPIEVVLPRELAHVPDADCQALPAAKGLS